MPNIMNYKEVLFSIYHLASGGVGTTFAPELDKLLIVDLVSCLSQGFACHVSVIFHIILSSTFLSKILFITVFCCLCFFLLRSLLSILANFFYYQKWYNLAKYLYWGISAGLWLFPRDTQLDIACKRASIYHILGQTEKASVLYKKIVEKLYKTKLINNVVDLEDMNCFSDVYSLIRYITQKNQAALERELEASQNREAEQRADLEHAKKLEYLNYMAGGVAHNINNPVGILRLAAQRGLRELEKNLSPEKAQEIFQRILTQADRLHNIIQNFRDYAKGDREKRETVALNAVVEQIKDYFSNQLAAHQIELITELAAENPHIEANHFVLQEVLINLISNARDALENQPNAQITITTWQQTEKVGISVADNGAGIPPEQQKSLFSPFHTTKAHGTGLGLNFAQKAVHELHGTIHYQEKSPRGACFVIEFPQNTPNDMTFS
jgi:two-component system C4-dicarboxylate transport sensor histidine kinase DctB